MPEPRGLMPIMPQRKEPANCAIFGAISFNGQPVSGRIAVEGICSAEAARGGDYGNGILFADPKRSGRGKLLMVWARSTEFAHTLRNALLEQGLHLPPFVRVGTACPADTVGNARGALYSTSVDAEYLPLLAAVAAANSSVGLDDAHIISSGHGLALYKGLDSLSVLDGVYGLSNISAPGILAHTKFPTGGKATPIRAHPFCFGNVGIVHNGDVTSYFANLAACEARLAEIHHAHISGDTREFMGWLRKSWVGTDSEVIAAMIYTMLKTGLVSEPGLSIPAIMSVLVPPFDNQLTKLLRGSQERQRLHKLLSDYRGFGLDGPVSCITMVTYEDDVHMLAFRDRNNFRPLQIVIDHGKGCAYAASELGQILNATGLELFSPLVEAYSIDPGKFFWVSSKSGIVSHGRERRPYISVPDMSSKPLSGHLKGTLHDLAGITLNDGEHRTYAGVLGNFGASYSDGNGTLEFFGSVQDNCLEASTVRRVVCHANAGMMLGNAFQGEQLFLRGSADSRALQQLRSKFGRQPVAIIGETAGTYLGKMISAGTIMVLGLEFLGREDMDTPIVGDFLGTGGVRGRILVRGHVPDELIRRPPQRRDIIAVCSQLVREGLLAQDALREIRHDPLDLARVSSIISSMDSNAEKANLAIARLSPLYISDSADVTVERRHMNEQEIGDLGPHISDFIKTFGLAGAWVDQIMKSQFTIVTMSPKP